MILAQPRCYLGDHHIPNGSYYVQTKFSGAPRYAVCFDCKKPRLYYFTEMVAVRLQA